MSSQLRIGHGYDVHRLVEGRRCIIGGVDIPHDKGLLGHSDADVLAHALADAIRRTYINIPLRQRMIAEGKEYALRFEPEPIARRLLDIYQSVCR